MKAPTIQICQQNKYTSSPESIFTYCLESSTVQSCGTLVLELFLALLTTFATLCTVSSHLLIVFLKSSQVLTSLRELTLLHTFTYIPVDECTLGVHKIEFVVNTREHLCNGCAVGDHAHRTLHLCKIATWYYSRGLVVDATLEASWAPVYKLNGSLGLNGGHSRIHILWHHITTVHQTARHVLAMSWIALGHHRRRLKCAVGDLSY
mmetsp:Transcript_13516/g.22200  ORF Transcript_13516/g.22200 Transcript_13516/m.22200 type:complete len:206 (-) Transcript_13516:942-1559(-)